MFKPLCIQSDYGLDKHVGKIAFEGLNSDWIPNKWNKKTLTYCVTKGSADIKFDSIERFMVGSALESWEISLDLKFNWVKASQHPDIDIAWVTSKEDGYFHSPSILAYAGYPETQFQGKLRLNDDNIWTPDGLALSPEQYTKLTGKPGIKGNTYKTYNGNQTLRHEIGHLLGAVHTESCPDCIMFPYYNKTLFPQKSDLEQLTPKYGRRVFKDPAVAENLRLVLERNTIDWKDKWELNI